MLVLVGSGEYLSGMEPVDRILLSRLQERPRVVCLPTAAGTEGSERIQYWSQLGVDHFTRLGAQAEALPVIDQDSANEATYANVISGANFVYLSGGKPNYLYNVLKDSHVWKAILNVLACGGILAGCSAGAMIMGEKFFGFPGWHDGFNFLPGKTVVPHYDEISETMLSPIRLLAMNAMTLLGVEGYTALVKSGEQYEVLGSGGVTVWNSHHKRRYTQGPIPGEVLAVK